MNIKDVTHSHNKKLVNSTEVDLSGVDLTVKIAGEVMCRNDIYVMPIQWNPDPDIGIYLDNHNIHGLAEEG